MIHIVNLELWAYPPGQHASYLFFQWGDVTVAFLQGLDEWPESFLFTLPEHQNQLYFQDAPSMLVVWSSGSLHWLVYTCLTPL